MDENSKLRYVHSIKMYHESPLRWFPFQNRILLLSLFSNTPSANGFYGNGFYISLWPMISQIVSCLKEIGSCRVHSTIPVPEIQNWSLNSDRQSSEDGMEQSSWCVCVRLSRCLKIIPAKWKRLAAVASSAVPYSALLSTYTTLSSAQLLARAQRDALVRGC